MPARTEPPTVVTHSCLRLKCVIQNSAMENPFQFGRELGADELADLEEELTTGNRQRATSK